MSTLCRRSRRSAWMPGTSDEGHYAQRQARTRRSNGFTLFELVLVVAIVAILAAIALPSYQNQMRKARRADAITAVTAVQLAEEKFRASNTAYGTLANLGFASPYPSMDGYYSVALSGPDGSGAPTATGYQVTATVVAGTAQASDTACPAIVLTVNGGATTQTPTACWLR